MEVRKEGAQVSVRGRWRLCYVSRTAGDGRDARCKHVLGQPMDRDRVAATIDWHMRLVYLVRYFALCVRRPCRARAMPATRAPTRPSRYTGLCLHWNFYYVGRGKTCAPSPPRSLPSSRSPSPSPQREDTPSQLSNHEIPRNWFSSNSDIASPLLGPLRPLSPRPRTARRDTQMPRAKATAPLAGLVGSDSEPDFDDFDVSDIQAARNQRQPISTTKKPRGRPPSASKVTKPAPRSTGRTRGKAATTTAATARKEALAGKSNSTTSRTTRQVEKQAQEDTIDVEDVTETPVVPSPRAKPNRGRPRGVGSAAKGNTASKIPASVPPSATRPRGRPRLRQAATPPEEIAETQPEEPEDTMDIDVSAQDLVDAESIPAPDPLEDVVGYDASDVSLRRRLGDLTKKYDSLEMRHRDLREVGVKEAERNFDRLRKQADERTAGKELRAMAKIHTANIH